MTGLDATTPRLFDPDEPLEGAGGRTLTAEQAAAVRRREGSLLLFANAGSGKTTVLVERFVRSVLEDDVPPAAILAITFTDKAAGELRERVRRRFVELGERERARETEAAWISTIHGFCARVLRGHALAAGLDPAFTVLDEAQARTLQAEAFDAALEGFVAAHGEDAVGFLAAYSLRRTATTIAAIHGLLRSQGRDVRLPPVAPAPLPDAERATLEAAARAAAVVVGGATGKTVERALATYVRCGELLAALRPGELPGPAALKALKAPGNRAKAMDCDACRTYDAELEAYAQACAGYRATLLWPLADALLRSYAEAYAEAKRSTGALDFDDLELHTRDLLRGDAAAREALAQRFTRIMVDEFQDTNPLQLQILEALERDNLFVVGDEFQSIYGFRHADVEVFRGRRRTLDRDGKALSLAANFRSEPQILGAINVAFAPIWPRDFVPLVPGGGPLPEPAEPLVELLVTDRKAWEAKLDAEPDLLGASAGMEQPWRRAEARLVAQRVRDLVDSGEAQAKEIVVLVRATGSIPPLERALSDQGLATAAIGGRGYWSRQQVQDLVAYLAALANPRDEQSLYAALASPLAGVSLDGLALVALEAQERGRDPWQVLREDDGGLAGLVPAGDAAALASFVARFTAERELAPRLALDELVMRVATGTGYDLHVLALPGGERRLANVHKLARLAATYEAVHGRDLRGFVDLAMAEEEADARETDAPVELADLDAVRLMTIHAAKGLEFDVVVMADLGRQGRVESPDLIVRGEQAGLRVMTLEPGKSEPALEYRELVDDANRIADDEERRVMYVAMTRARRRLILSGTVDPGAWPEAKPGAPPISWVGPAFVTDVAARVAAGGAPQEDVAVALEGFASVVRVARNAPDTVGPVLRACSLLPASEPASAARQPPPVAAAEPAPGPAPAAPAPAAGAAALSYSSLSAYAACGYRFYLEKVLRVPGEDDPAAAAPGARAGLDPRSRGSIVHALLEDLDFAAPSAPGDEQLAAAAAPYGGTPDAAGAADVSALVAAFAGSGLCRRLARGSDVRREHVFAFALGGPGEAAPLINGVVDVRAREGERALVVDYKTDRVEDGADLGALVERGYDTQRRIYALAELRAGAPEAEVVHVFLERPDEPVSVTFAAADVGDLEAHLRALAGGIAEGRFAVAPDPHRALCSGCPARRALCVHGEELTLREAPGDPPVATEPVSP